MAKQFKAEIQWLDPRQLTPYANNAKVHTVEQIDKIAGQIATFGFDQPIVVDENFVIIKGHGRREASIRLNLDKVPVIVRSDLTEYEIMAARLGDNEVAKGEYNTELLRFELGTLQRVDFNLKATGFELKKIENLLNVDDLVETESEPKTKDKGSKKEVSDSDGGDRTSGGMGDSGESVLPEGSEDQDSDSNQEAATQFIVTVHCENEEQMKAVYEEMVQRGFECKLIT